MNPFIAAIKPTLDEEKRVKAVTVSFLKKLNANLTDATAILGGSGAKGTWLSGNHDLDIFVLFPLRKYASRSGELSEIIEPILEKLFPQQQLKRVHGSRDYFQLMYEGFNIEVVPILKIARAEQAVNITDVSPLHTKWVSAKSAAIKDEILLAKQFCKAQSLYGAESYITGFSGYVLEILTSNYGSFEKLLRSSLKWKKNEVIDVEKHYPHKNALFHLNQSKVRSPLIVIDPVDKSRNAAAALSDEKCLLFQQKAKEYLTKPSADFFVKKEVLFDSWKADLQRRSHYGAWIRLLMVEGKEDVVGVKIIKIIDFLEKELAPFSVLKTGFVWDKSSAVTIYIEVEKKQREGEEIKPGPPLTLTLFVADFKKKNKDTFVEKDRIMARVKVGKVSLADNLKMALKKEYVVEKIFSVEDVIIM